jgi:exonuclease SbcD
MQTDASVRNVLIAHQFITGGETSDEEIYVGNSENIDSSVFADFDYVALGHLHRPQYIERESLRYCGSPLKYSLSEANHDKSVTVVDMADKIETPKISLLPLNPIHDVREIRGTYAEIMNRKNYRGTNIDDFVHIVLTDEDEEFDAMAKLRAVYPNLLDLVYDNTRTQTEFSLETTNPAEGKMPLELLGEFYENQNGIPMSEEQLTYAENLFTEIFKEIIL